MVMIWLASIDCYFVFGCDSVLVFGSNGTFNVASRKSSAKKWKNKPDQTFWLTFLLLNRKKKVRLKKDDTWTAGKWGNRHC